MRPLLSFIYYSRKKPHHQSYIKVASNILYAILKTSRNISASTKDKNSKYPGNPGKGAFLCFKSHILKKAEKIFTKAR